MAPVSYLLSITASRDDKEILLAIFNIAGMGRAIYAEYGNDISKSLWIIPKGKETQLEVEARLLSEPAIQSASVVGLNNQVTESELTDVRRLFTDVGWDTSDVNNDELSIYVNAALKRQYNYYIDFDHKEKVSAPVKIRVKPIQEHPEYSAEWLQQNIHYEEEDEDKVFTFDDFEIVQESFEESIELDDENEMPPPPSDEPR